MRRYKYQLVFDETDEVYYDSETAWEIENLKKIIVFHYKFWNMAFIFFTHIVYNEFC